MHVADIVYISGLECWGTLLCHTGTFQGRGGGVGVGGGGTKYCKGFSLVLNIPKPVFGR